MTTAQATETYVDFPDIDWQGCQPGTPYGRTEGSVVRAIGGEDDWYVSCSDTMLITSVCWLCETPQAKWVNAAYVEHWQSPDIELGAYWWCKPCGVGWASKP